MSAPGLGGVKGVALVVSCEHGGHAVPPAYAELFAGHEALLASHRGWDPGAAQLARELAKSLGVRPLVATVSRLLVELNRSPGHPRLFSAITRPLPKAAREAIVADYYQPHRQAVTQAVAEGLAAHGRVLHVACHSFTPELHGVARNADVGLLYDPGHGAEQRFALAWQAELLRAAPALRVRRNFPYRGAADGLPTWLRRRFGAGYAGLELEINQRFPLGLAEGWDRLRGVLITTLPVAMETLNSV